MKVFSDPRYVLYIFAVIVSVLFYTAYNQINVQRKQISSLHQTIKEVNTKLEAVSKLDASTSAQIKLLLNKSSSAPEINYITQPQQQNSTECPYPYVRTGGKCVNFYYLRGN